MTAPTLALHAADGSSSRRPNAIDWLATVVVFLATAATFSGALANDFVNWDDDVNFLHNPHIRSFGADNLRWMFTTFHVGHYMPLTWLSCALDHQLWGLDPRGFHLTNVVLHALTAAVLQRVLLRVARLGFPHLDRGIASLASATGAAFFALHPLRVESVAWATERRDVLAGVLLIATVLAWLRSFDPHASRRGWRVVAHALFALSLLSKVSGMTLPVALLVLDVIPLRRGLAWSCVAEKIGFFALALVAAAVGALGQRLGTEVMASSESVPWLHRVAIAVHAVAFYLYKTAVPSGLSPLYELDERFVAVGPRTIAAGTIFVSITLAAWIERRRHPALLGVWIAFVALLAPTSGLAQSGRQLAADRYTYLAALALAAGFMAAHASARMALARREARLGLDVLVALVLGALAFVSVGQVRVWRSSETLWRHAARIDPNGSFVRHKLGITLHQLGDSDEAIEHYEAALRASAGRPSPDIRYDLALSYVATGDGARARSALLIAVDEQPRFEQAWRVLEDVSVGLGDVDGMVERYAIAIARDPDFVPTRLGLARLLARVGRYQESHAAAQGALAVDPTSPSAHNRVGVTLLHLERASEAEGHFRRAIEIEPLQPDFWGNLGMALKKQGRADEARAAWTRALELDPEHAGARRQLAQ